MLKNLFESQLNTHRLFRPLLNHTVDLVDLVDSSHAALQLFIHSVYRFRHAEITRLCSQVAGLDVVVPCLILSLWIHASTEPSLLTRGTRK